MRVTSRDIQLTRQIGEHLVAAELGRRGYLATPFAGNVPVFDVLAADLRGFAIPIQVKAIKGGSWQFSADKFLQIKNIKGEVQHVLGRTTLVNPDLVCVFVALKPGGDEFYIFPIRILQEYCERI